MTKEITKSIILQEIQDKLTLREFAPANFLFDETVVPVYNIEPHLEKWWQKYKSMSVSGTGAYYFFTVPGNERWHLKRYDVVLMTGVYTVAGAFITRKNRDPGDASVYLDLAAAQSVSYHKETDTILSPCDTLNVNVDGYTSTGTLRLYIDCKVETIR